MSGSRGNLTSVAAQANGTTTLYRKFTYYDLGTLNTSTDVSTSSTTNGPTTTYNYTPGASSCNSAFATSISEPMSLSRSMSWNCVGAVLTSLTDENGNPSSTSYTDPYYWRPHSSTDAAGNTTTFSYSPNGNTSLPTQTESTLLFNSNNSVVDQLTVVDGFGRLMLNQKKQGPNATNYDTTETDYDIAGCGVSRTTLPYSATQGQTNPNAPGTNTGYDGACRPTSTTDSGGGTTTYTYTYNDTYQTLGPAPTGENAKRKQLEYGGLGWLKSVCEITAGTGPAPAGTCGQSSSATGYWTTYNYDPLGNQTGVTQNAQLASGSRQSRTMIYDMLGRLTSEVNPETNKLAVTYSYDTLSGDAACGTVTSAGNMLKQVDAAGNAACSVYDSLHRVTSVTYPSTGTPQKNFVYDTATVNGINMLGAKTRLAEAYTCTGTCTSKITDLGFTYSALGQVTEVYQHSTNSSGYYHASSQYWPSGAVNTLSGLPGLPTITYAAESEGRIGTVAASSGQNPVTAITYNTASQVTAITFGSADSDGFTFDPNTGRLAQYQFNVGSGGSNTPAFVQSTYRGQNANATSFSTAFTSNVTSGDLLFVTFANGTTNSISTISDTLGNTYTALPLIAANGFRLQAFYTFSTASGPDTVTGTFSGSGATYIQETLAEYSNVGAVDAHAENSGGNSQPSTTTTATASSDLVIGYVTDSYVTWTGETGWNLRTTGSGIRAALQDTIAANPGSITSTFNTVNGWNAGIVAFKATSSGGSDKGVLTWNPNWSLKQLAITDQVYTGGTHTCNYSHDDMGRVASANCGAQSNQTFSYDALGNINKIATAGISFQPGYDVTTNRINTSPFTYDGNNGNLKTDSNHTYGWDTTGKMTSVDLGTANGVCLTYDALGRMVEQGRGSGCASSYTEIVYAPSGAKLALMNGQSLVKAFVSLPSGEAVYTSTGLAYYRHQDWLGNSRLATTPSRTMYYDTAYAPFGENYQSSGTMDLSFTGQNQDTIAGGVPGNLYDFLYREDNPSHGRWLSPDPAGSTAVDPTSPQTWNRYAYVGNSPLSAVDPLGLCQVSERGGPYLARPHSCSPPVGPPDWGGGGAPSGQPGGSSSSPPHGAWPNGETLGLPQGLNTSPLSGLDNLLAFVPGLFCGRTTGIGLTTTTSTPSSRDVLCPLLTVVIPVLAVFQATKNSTSDQSQPGLCKPHECPGRACYIDNCTSLNGPGGRAVQGFDCVAADKKGKDCCIDSYDAFATKCKARNIPGYPIKYKPNYDPGASGNISGECCQLYQ